MNYTNAYVFNGTGFEKGGFGVENGRFTEAAGAEGIDLKGAYVIPGLVEIHSHGNSGADFYDADPEGLKKMAKYYADNGITSFCPASMTLPYDMLDKAFRCGRAFADAPATGLSKLSGINMEGPYFSEKKKGAQNGEYLKAPDFEGFRKLYEGCRGLIKIVDLAPELEGSVEFIENAKELCTVSVAHTDASYEEAKAAFDAGATHLTHLFNAMPGIHHRKPAVIGAAAENENVFAELICDGYHVHPSAVRMAFKLFPGRICLISDSLRCTGMPDGEYDFAGQKIYLSENIARLADGTIAGSASNLHRCMLNAISFGIPVAEAINAATINPAREIGLGDEIGSIEPGKAADFVVCDEKLNILDVYIEGVRHDT